jgi:hypothetical protein
MIPCPLILLQPIYFCFNNHLTSPLLSTILHECGCRLWSGFLYPLFWVVIKAALPLPSLFSSFIMAEPVVAFMLVKSAFRSFIHQFISGSV